MKRFRTTDYALVFPGQGSQYVGMGLDIFKEFISAEKIFESAEEVSNLDIRNICFFGNEENLIETSITQPCLLATNIALYTVFQEHFSRKPKFLCGHSAGEYSALVAAGVLSFADAMSLLQVRGALMSRTQGGGMVALKGVTFDQAEKLCRLFMGILFLLFTFYFLMLGLTHLGISVEAEQLETNPNTLTTATLQAVREQTPLSTELERIVNEVKVIHCVIARMQD